MDYAMPIQKQCVSVLTGRTPEHKNNDSGIKGPRAQNLQFGSKASV